MNGTLHSQILERIGSDLSTDTLQPGDVLSAATLTERYGASRSIVREVIKVLEQHGVVATRRRIGATVQPESAWAALSPMIVRWRLDGPSRYRQLRELSELRSGVEPVAAALAAVRATDEQRSTMHAAVVDMASAGPRGDLERYIERDIVFHSTMLEASGNAAMASLAPLVAASLTGGIFRQIVDKAPEACAIQWHFDAATAIVMGQPDKAREAISLIVSDAHQAMERVMGSGK